MEAPETNKIINCLYEHFKNTPQKLKIICDWDEVIQAHEPYATYLTLGEVQEDSDFKTGFECFWYDNNVEYSPYGSKVKEGIYDAEKQRAIKNSPDFYQQAPFLTIAKELLKLIKENKVEQIIFLTAYDKRKFPHGDPRKKQIFKETFGKYPNCSLQLIGFDSEKQGANKADWIKENASDYDIVIDDNPNILRRITESNSNLITIAPYYPAIKNQHHRAVLLVKTSVSNLKKRDFEINNNHG